MKIISVILVLAIAAAVYWLYRPGQGQQADEMGGNRFDKPALVIVEPVHRDTIADTMEAIGTTSANESVTLTAKVTDTVSRINFDDGDYVTTGQVLVELTNNEESALLAEAQANMDDAAAQLRRLTNLDKQKLVSSSDVDQARAQADAARGRLNAILARLDDRLVRAPFDGLLGFRQVSPGTLLTTNTPITTLDDISVIKLDFSVPELFLDVLRPGLKILAQSATWKDHQFEGEIRTVDTRINPVTRAVTVRALIQNKDRLLRPGMLMTVQIQSNPRTSLVVRESALTQVGPDTFVYIAGEDGRAHQRQVQVGTRLRGVVEVTGGLREGERVITEGVIRDGGAYQAAGVDTLEDGGSAGNPLSVKPGTEAGAAARADARISAAPGIVTG